MNFIIPIVVGAVIGYITNWLAIKMLFRPHEKKKIFGVTIPFTPGLIPKERKRIANSVGEAVGEHLLSPSVITSALSSESTDKAVKIWIKDKYESLKDRDKSIYELLEAKDLDNFKQIIGSLSENISSYILDQVNNNEFKEMILRYIDLNIYDNNKDAIITTLKTKGNEYLNKVISSHDTKLFIEKLLLIKIEELNNDQRQLSDIISKDSLDTIRDILEKNKLVIGDSIKEVFNDPNINHRLTKSISELVNQNISKVITMFISPDQISEKILQVVEKYINGPNSNDDYIMLINNGIDKLMENKVSSILSSLQPLINEESISEISTVIQDSINEEMIVKLINDIESKYLDSEDDIKKYILSYISTYMDNLILSPGLKDGISTFVRDSIDNILNKPISSILEKVEEDTITTTINILKSTFDTFAENELPRIIEFFDVSSIVEKQINSFDVEYTEKLILDIANKELKAITWLGALLGALMGILTPLLQML